jgi:hypothetical protein
MVGGERYVLVVNEQMAIGHMSGIVRKLEVKMTEVKVFIFILHQHGISTSLLRWYKTLNTLAMQTSQTRVTSYNKSLCTRSRIAH